MLLENMIGELVFSVKFCSAVISKITNLIFVLGMSSLMVVSVSNCIKHLAAELTWVRLFSCVDSLVNLQISSLIEHFVAKYLTLCTYVIPNRLVTNKFSLYFLNVSCIKYISAFVIVFNFLISFIVVLILVKISVNSFLIF